MAAEQAGYFRRSWNDLKQDKRWWQPMMILSLVNMIPVVGQLIASGYLLDWGKEAAWGVDKPLFRKVGSIGKRLKYGFFAALILFVWNIVPSVVGSILTVIPLLGGLLSLVCSILAVIAVVVGMGGVMRMLIYDRLGPGFQVKRTINMARADSSGLWRIFGICLIASAVLFALVLVVVVPLCIVAGVTAYIDIADTSYSYGYGSIYFDGDYALSPSVFALVAGMLPTLLVVGFVFSFVSMFFDSIVCRAYGHWVAQFHPESWGSSDDEMPFEKELGKEKAPEPPLGTEDAAASGRAVEGSLTTASGEDRPSPVRDDGSHEARHPEQREGEAFGASSKDPAQDASQSDAQASSDEPSEPDEPAQQ